MDVNNCAHCGSTGRLIRNRGLCSRCYYDPEIRCDYPKRLTSYTDLIEDVQFLIEQDCTLTEAIARLGKKRETVRRALDRAGRLDLYRTLAAREPDYETRRKPFQKAVA